MPNINFVPDDYVQRNESRRANLMCLVLFAVVMAGLTGTFVTIKIRQRAWGTQEAMVNAELARMQESIEKFEELRMKQKEIIRTGVTMADLLEPVPRSVLLASLTNSLPPGVSLVKLNMIQKDPTGPSRGGQGPRNKYQAAQGQTESEASFREKFLETHMDLEGMAPSDLQVASYIEHLGNSVLVDDVALVESKEQKVDDALFRHFRLTAMLDKNIHLGKEDIEAIKAKAQHSVNQF